MGLALACGEAQEVSWELSLTHWLPLATSSAQTMTSSSLRPAHVHRGAHTPLSRFSCMGWLDFGGRVQLGGIARMTRTLMETGLTHCDQNLPKKPSTHLDAHRERRKLYHRIAKRFLRPRTRTRNVRQSMHRRCSNLDLPLEHKAGRSAWHHLALLKRQGSRRNVLHLSKLSTL